jgi:hypothetical protein
LVFLLLVLNVLADRLFVAHEITSRPEALPNEIALSFAIRPARWIALFPLIYPTTFETAYFGGIDNSM